MDNKIIVDCEKRIGLKDYLFIDNISTSINGFNQKDEDVLGDILVQVSYQDKDTNQKEYEELIPFEVTLLNDKEIDEININNFNYYDVVGIGIQCSFQLNILLKDKEIIEDNKLEKDNENIYNNKINNLENENNNLDLYEETIEDQVEPLEEEIKQKYTEILDDIFNINYNVSNEEVELVNEEIKQNDISTVEEIFDDIKNKELYLGINDRNDEKISFKNIKESYGVYRVYYPKEENEIDKVCTVENVSLTAIYGKEFNKDFSKKKRIIIDK